MGIGEMIEKRRKQMGLTLEEVGNAVGVSKSTVKKWETGYIANMKRDKIALLARVLQVSPADFIVDSAPSESNVSEIITTNLYSIPVFASVSAGFGAYADSEILEYIPLYIKNPYEAEETLAIKVKGDSMYPKIEDGDIIVVRKQDSVDSGAIAVVLVDGDEALVKKVEYDKNEVDLISINPEYKTRIYRGEDLQRLRVIGLVKQVVKML